MCIGDPVFAIALRAGSPKRWMRLVCRFGSRRMRSVAYIANWSGRLSSNRPISSTAERLVRWRPVAEAASRLGVPYGLDLEDFHSGEDHGSAAALTGQLATRVEGAVLPPAAFLTTSSAEIADAYRATYGVGAVVIHNTFPLPRRPP
jgi:hypothetical protein